MNYDIEELIKQYGNEFLMDTDPDNALYDMDSLGELLPQDPWDAFMAGFRAGKFANFNPSDDFYTFDGYGRHHSVSHYDYYDYLTDHIDEDYFIEWCERYGYIDEYEMEEYEDEE